MRTLASSLCLALVSFGLIACGDGPAPTDAGVERPLILEILAPDPALEGSILEVRGLGLGRLGLDARLVLDRAGGMVGTLPTSADGVEGRLLFEVSADLVRTLGAGTHALSVRATGGGLESDPHDLTLHLVTSLPVDLVEVPTGEVHRNDVGVVVGAGVIGPTEGTLVARFVGTFTLDAGGSAPVDVSLDVTPLERGDRERGVLILSTDIGGLMPGTFDGTVQLASTLRSGERSESSALSTSLHFNPPDLYGLEPPDAAVGQILIVRGAGFLGGSARPDETTLIRLEGEFTPAGGGAAEPFAAQELVPRWVSGAEVQLTLEPVVSGDRVVAELFGHTSGTFVGLATPIAIKGVEELEGVPVPFGFALGALRQVVYVHFLPGFYASLSRFGLAQAAPEIELAVRARIEEIFTGWSVDIRLDEPEDFSRTAYSVLEIGGPDPNGVGLFGYDNTPGKDVGNLRLFDAIGGANAETQMDGSRGYGGVFVESFLYWSEHPELPGERPFGAPDPAPLFDEVFDPVRAEPASRAEAMGEGDATRVTAVARAIAALASIIGETASHEIGHSLGMAQPYGPPTTYHNDFDGDGCLMDIGGDRPLGERMGEGALLPTHFCYDHPDYLFEILSP